MLQETVDIPQLQSIDKLGVVQFLDKGLALGSDRGVPAAQIMDFVEKIPFVRVFVEQIVVCQCHRSWRFSWKRCRLADRGIVPQITEES